MISGLMQAYAVHRPKAPLPIQERTEHQQQDQEQEHDHLTTEETVRYQRWEITKELVLLQNHLQQGCKIGGKACDCCTKHPMALEALAQETAGMTSDPVFRELADWTRKIRPITSEQASASGKYDEQYHQLAVEARNFRKAIMPDLPYAVSVEKEVENGPELPPTEEER